MALFLVRFNSLQAYRCLTQRIWACYKVIVMYCSGFTTHVAPENHMNITTERDFIVNKSELIEAIAQEADLSKASAAKALDGMISAVTNALKGGDTVTLVGFGTFYVGERAARAGRNPKTGEPLEIKAAKTPKFRAGKALKDAL